MTLMLVTAPAYTRRTVGPTLLQGLNLWAAFAGPVRMAARHLAPSRV
jgi:hypothetical protein